jgi:hypothetical protein
MLVTFFALANAATAMMQTRVLKRTKLQRQCSCCCYLRRLHQVQQAGTTGRQCPCAREPRFLARWRASGLPSV